MSSFCFKTVRNGCCRSAWVFGLASLVLPASAWAGSTCPTTCSPGVDTVAIFGFRTFSDSQTPGGTQVGGLTMAVTDAGTDPGSGAPLVDFTFRAIAGNGLQGLSKIWFDDECSPTMPLLNLFDIIPGPDVSFSQGATPGDPPGGGAACPEFATTDSFTASSDNQNNCPNDTDSGDGCKVGEGEFLTLRFSLQSGQTYCDVITCLQQAEERDVNGVPTPRPGCDDAQSVPGLRVAVNLDFPGAGSSCLNAPCAFIGGDCDTDGIPDECELDCSGGGGFCSIFSPNCGTASDCNTNDIPDECEQDVCDDSDACTDDSCDPATGCVHTPVDCDDQNACTIDTCNPATGCVHTPVDCDDNNACTVDTCDPATGCVHTPVDCDDHNACTVDTCDPATGCVHTPVDCDDQNACTIDTCNPATGCVHTPVDCDDNNACTIDTCNPATGCVHTPVDCDDGLACTIDTCDPATGCVHTPADTDSDGVNDCVDVCPGTPAQTPVDAQGCSCPQASLLEHPLDVDSDGVPDICDECPLTPPGTLVDGQGCSCAQLGGGGGPDADDDGVPDACDQCPGTPQGQPVNGDGCSCGQIGCDDKDPCTTDTCNAGVCAHDDDDDDDGVTNCNDDCPGTPPGQPVNPDGCSCGQVNCDDGNPCTLDTCNAGICSHVVQDADHDGVCDANDQCPNTPAGEPVNAAGCSCSQLDDDHDGVNNCDDQCPGTEAGQEVDASGCVPEPAPQPVAGACCLPDATCQSAADAAACTASGGIFAGVGTDCSTTSCECGQPGGLSLAFSYLSFAPVCGGGCLMMIPLTFIGILTMRGTRRPDRRSRFRRR